MILVTGANGFVANVSNRTSVIRGYAGRIEADLYGAPVFELY